jgi:foldase protein PrsA
VSPNQGRRRTSGKGGRGNPSGFPSDPVAVRRLGLLVFGVVFVALFVIVAIAEGIGHPSVPSGDVAYVEEAPEGSGDITKADFRHGLAQVAAQSGQKKLPKPGSKQYAELKETTLNNLLEPIWLAGLGEELGITVSDKEVAAEFKKLKKENFKTEAEYKKVLKQANFTQADVDERVKLQILSTQVQEQLKENVPKPSKGEVEDYYEAAKATQFTQKESRDIRIVVNKNRKQAKEAREALSKDDSAKNWSKVAKKYSEEPTTSQSGGLRKGATEESLEEPLAAAVFNTPEGQVEGPIKTGQGYTVFEVENSTPESVQELKTVESQIESTLAQRAEQEYFSSYVAGFNAKWTGRTVCASGYVTERCGNFEGSGHPSTAPAGCYEANPKGGRPEACPAPVFQLVPALPGTVTPLEPRGEALPQRPRPAGLKEEGEGEEGTAGLPEGLTPEGAAPEEAPPAEEPPAEEESSE